jgi:hypothetical protein
MGDCSFEISLPLYYTSRIYENHQTIVSEISILIFPYNKSFAIFLNVAGRKLTARQLFLLNINMSKNLFTAGDK